MVVMTRVEDGRLLKLKGTSTRAQNFVYLSHYDKDTFSFSLLWHDIFGNINYDSLRLLKKKGVFGFPTITRKLKQCDACILGKYSKQPFHDSTSRTCRKIRLIHFDFCVHVPIPSVNENKCIMYFIDDYIKMCWVYLLNDKSHAFENFKKFHVWIQNEAQSHIDTLFNDNRR